ncbi:MAG: DUF116 domain-containing protein [Candidatus Zixiibacteriota bacterium]|nr:MAG: DUF116 domain-containing protein [candidate division Zixibacteria bacterium]
MDRDHPTYRLGEDFNQKLETFVRRFLKDGFAHFSKEFERIDQFVERAHNDVGRDDSDLRQNPKEKYLLELVAFKIYDKLNRHAFNQCKNTLIVMPDCLSIHDKECEKVEKKYGFFCRRCQQTCQAYQIGDLAAGYGVKIVFSKRKLAQQIEYFAKRMEDLGVIGIACIMMLASGMRTASEVGVPARGVPLNFTGCEHWNDTPFASEFTMTSLRSILEEKYGPRD